MTAQLENKDYCVSAWLEDGKIPASDTVVTLQAVLSGRFIFLDSERRPLVLKELQALQQLYAHLDDDCAGMHLTEDPPRCVLCKKACHLGHTQTWSPDSEGNYALISSKCPDCVILEHRQEYVRTKTINTALCRRAYLERNFLPEGGIHDKIYAEIHEGMEQLHVLVRRFESKIWKGGLGRYFLSREHRGMEAPLASGAPLMIYCLGGRVQCQLGDGTGVFFNMITTDEPIDPQNKMGVLGLRATVEEAQALFQEVFDAWDAETLYPKNNSNIGILGL